MQDVDGRIAKQIATARSDRHEEMNELQKARDHAMYQSDGHN